MVDDCQMFTNSTLACEFILMIRLLKYKSCRFDGIFAAYLFNCFDIYKNTFHDNIDTMGHTVRFTHYPMAADSVGFYEFLTLHR